MIIVPYKVVKDLYYAPDATHSVTMTTTEYTYKNNILVHLHIGKNLGIRLNNMLQYEFNKGIEKDQYFYKKTYHYGKPKVTTHGTFDEKLKRFNASKTTVEKEIVEEYNYIDKNGTHTFVQVAVVVKNDVDMTASIDFKDATQYKNFVCPVWLTELT